MTEAEVALRLAEYLFRQQLTRPKRVDVSIDGAQVRIAGGEIFPVDRFLQELGWNRSSPGDGWRGDWIKVAGRETWKLVVSARSGQGDVVADFAGGQRLRVEAKGGPIQRSASSVEYRKLREALGQCLTVAEHGSTDILAVAAPAGERFKALAERWRVAPLVAKLRIGILLVSEEGELTGFDRLALPMADQ